MGNSVGQALEEFGKPIGSSCTCVQPCITKTIDLTNMGTAMASSVCCTEGENEWTSEHVNSPGKNLYHHSAAIMGHHDEYGYPEVQKKLDLGGPYPVSEYSGGISRMPTVERDARPWVEATAPPPGQQYEMMQSKIQYPADFMRLIEKTRETMTEPPVPTARKKDKNIKRNRYGGRETMMPVFDTTRHVPTLAVLDCTSGTKAGKDILSVARHSKPWKDRFFDVNDTESDVKRGGMLDVFRMELCAAKEEARQLRVRPRVIAGGADSMASRVIILIFRALKADSSRTADGWMDTGNGFIWNDAELQDFFPALAPMPLGIVNDLANGLGWGPKVPGDSGRCLGFCTAKQRSLAALSQWMLAVVDPNTQIENFDIWGILPAHGQSQCNFKVCELGGKPGRTPKTKVLKVKKKCLQMREAARPAPFFVVSYFSTGLGAYLRARTLINRRSTPFRNRLERLRQTLGIIFEKTPPQLKWRVNGVKIECLDRRGSDIHADEADPNQGHHYFPPRRGKKTKGKAYREVGFYNVNGQGGWLRGKDRAPCTRRCGCLGKMRRPVRFNDGFLDMYRMRLKSFIKNPGSTFNTDKKRNMTLTFEATQGQGLFFQYDGVSRFAFSPSGEAFHIHVEKVLNIPVVLGPYMKAADWSAMRREGHATFDFCGSNVEEKEFIRERILQILSGELDAQLNATAAEIEKAGLPLDPKSVSQNSANSAPVYIAPVEAGVPRPKNPKIRYGDHPSHLQ
mmetsp:Transcript_11247/g.21237  ORF Transcript_11247/g.21237 Transcript_11247/m.21237 type:complete len:738 (-) Transcript_11247:20-2233(-)